MRAVSTIAGLAGLMSLIAPVAQAAPRVVALDQCADQYVLALSPRETIVGLSYRADDADSPLRALARGLPQRRIATESIMAARPTLAVRYWGGDARLEKALAAHGVRVVKIDDATDSRPAEGIRDTVEDIRRD